MKGEIKEVLDSIKVQSEEKNWIQLSPGFIQPLLDYITNLQQIEQDHQKLNGELREENERLKVELENKLTPDELVSMLNQELVRQNKNYKSRNEKAMKLLKEFYDSGSCPLRNISKAYEILNGDDKDVKD